MGNSLFEQFNAKFDLAGLQKDVESAASTDGEFEDVPHGSYEVRINRLELGVTSEQAKNPNMPMAKVWFEVVAGEFEGRLIFMNQTLTSGFGIHKMNTFLNSLESGITITFTDFVQYEALLTEVFDAVKDAEYQLNYGTNKKGYGTYDIVQKF